MCARGRLKHSVPPMKPRLAIVLLLSLFRLHAEAPKPEAWDGERGSDFVSRLNLARIEVISSGGMDFENSSAQIDDLTLEFGTFLAKPIELFDGVSMLPYLRYESHWLQPDAVPAGIPLEDEHLQQIDLPLFFYSMQPGSRWIRGAWIAPSIASDFESVSGDDFFLNAAAGAGYRFSDRLFVAAAVGALNLTGDSAIFPGIGFFWSPADDCFLALFGPNFRAAWEPTDSWRLAFEMRPNGGIWNIDNAAGSQNIDFRSFRIGLASSHRLSTHLWLTYGGGITAGNRLEITNTDGSELHPNALGELDQGFYGFLSLGLRAW